MTIVMNDIYSCGQIKIYTKQLQMKIIIWYNSI